ncbi:unnamed protein product, partial [Symbiodinium microadriaticum]
AVMAELDLSLLLGEEPHPTTPAAIRLLAFEEANLAPLVLSLLEASETSAEEAAVAWLRLALDFREIAALKEAVSKTGSIEEEQLNPFKVTKDQTKVLSQCFARMGWKLKHTADEAKKFAKGGVRPGKIETVNDTMEAQEKLFSDATGLLKKWGARIAVVKASTSGYAVTKPLPPHWQGPYTPDRARQWMCDLIDEPMTTLLFAVSKEHGAGDTERSGDEDDALKMASDSIVGLVIAFELAVEGSDFQKDIRLGYLLSERFWGQGFASELVRGFVSWCRQFNGTDTRQIASIIGGVARTNVASKRVLVKNGFQSISSGSPLTDGEDEPEEEEFHLQLIC